MTRVKPFKQENQKFNLYKKGKTRNTYEPHMHTHIMIWIYCSTQPYFNSDHKK